MRQHFARGPLLQLDLDAGVGLAEPHQHARDVDLPGGQRRPDPDLASDEVAELIDLVAQAVDLSRTPRALAATAWPASVTVTDRLLRLKSSVPSSASNRLI